MNYKCILIAGMGGMMPTLCKLATVFASNTETLAPKPGVYVALLLFFIIGSILALAFSECDTKRAFTIGIAAPGLITNIMAGVKDPSIIKGADLFSVNKAYSEQIQPNTPNAQPNDTNELNMQTSLDLYVYTLLGDTNSAIDVSGITFMIMAVSSNQEKLVGIFSAGKSSSKNSSNNVNKNIVNIPKGSSAIKIYANDKVVFVPLPKEKFRAANLIVKFNVSPANDLLWALGTQRHYLIDVSATINNMI